MTSFFGSRPTALFRKYPKLNTSRHTKSYTSSNISRSIVINQYQTYGQGIWWPHYWEPSDSHVLDTLILHFSLIKQQTTINQYQVSRQGIWWPHFLGAVRQPCLGNQENFLITFFLRKTACCGVACHLIPKGIGPVQREYAPFAGGTSGDG